jgi:RHS repeat-associated protein
MSDASASRLSTLSAALFVLVALILVSPIGVLVTQVVAQSMGGNQPPGLAVQPDPLSDQVSATAAEFGVDESGAATYSVPLFTVPGTAGVTPQLSLSYSSQAGHGPLGKGWSIGGLSSITRCRATREAGDFLGAATPDGNPAPINFSASDRFCLDGQRLIPAAVACPAAGGLTASAWATEIDSFQRICAYSNGAAGPAFFTVQRKDGSTSWYGDRDNNATANRPDGYFETTSALNPAAALSWAQTRFQDSTGNYIDYLYLENPAGAGTGEHLLSEVRYTGKIALPGQASGNSAPYAKVVFNYAARGAERWSRGYASGGLLTQSQRLESITSCGSIECPVQDQARHYLLTYATSVSASNLDTLVGLQECRDRTSAVCASPTSFAWSQGRHEFASSEQPAELQVKLGNFKGFKLGDVNGDGRPDFVYLRTGSAPPPWRLGGGQCGVTDTEHMVVALGSLNAAGTPGFTNGQVVCTSANLRDRGEGAWHLLDYNGDGRDDLFLSGAVGQGWSVYLSNGAGFDPEQNPIAGLSPAIPSYNGKNDQVQLADLNGDGLTDIVYPSGGALRARLMERLSAGFGWGNERMIVIDEATLGPVGEGCDDLFNPDVRCTRTISGAPTPSTGFNQMADFNGDAASDLLIQVSTRIERQDFTLPGCNMVPMGRPSGPGAAQAAPGPLPYIAQAPSDQDPPVQGLQSGRDHPCWSVYESNDLHAFTVRSLTADAIVAGNYGAVSRDGAAELNLADVNGDGLTEVFFRVRPNSNWQHNLNTGNGFTIGAEIPLQDFLRQTRFVDINGDGRADLLHPFNGGNYKAYNVKLAQPDGSYGPETWLPGVPGRHANAFLCQYQNCPADRFVPIFADFDGDGNVDFMSIKMDDNPDLYVSRGDSRFAPRDVITRIVNGLGAQTDITYAPLTNKDLYRRDSGARNGVNWGRGSPVMDLLAPSYAVARVSSSAPQAGAPDAMATVHYRYAGAKVQAGGRGFLGFRQIETIDPNQSGGYVVTQTTYAQNFPFVGMPVKTVKAAVLNQAYQVPSCLNGLIDNACFGTPGQPFDSLGGSVFSSSAQHWEIAPGQTLASQAPLHVRTLGTEESLTDPYSGVQTSRVNTAFGYGSYGNVTQTIVDTYSGSEPSPSATVITANTYSDDPGAWLLGRLTGSTVTHRRPGQPDVVRTTGFSYQMSGPATGLLVEERTAPGGAADQALTVRYTLDDYGNRVQSTTCAAPASDCSTAGFQFQPADARTIKRYSRVEYDARGRFPVATVEPFWSATGGEERTTSRVQERNVFGDVISARDVNNVGSTAITGALGRDFFTSTQTSPDGGLDQGSVRSLTTYRWCTQVACPAGAKFRQQVVTTGAPRQWSWFDVLGRPVMKAAETFNAGVASQDVSAVCTGYEATGKPVRSSHPFFLPGTAGADGPSEVSGVCAAPERQWTVSQFDVLGRPVRVSAPDGSQVSSRYSGLATTTVDPRGNLTVQVRNGAGELVTSTDAAGLVTAYGYTAAGNLASVGRNAGAGAIVNAFVYDGRGRKVRQTDPDTGTTVFEYNALGELIAQVDGAGGRIEHQLDARGRVWRKSVRRDTGAVESQSTFVFDTAPHGSGALAQESITGVYAGGLGEAGTALSFSRQPSYDALGRPIATATTIDGQTYSTRTEYDLLGRPWKSQDASGQWTKTQYGPRGLPVAVCASGAGDLDPACGSGEGTYQRVLATDAWGNTVRERRGDRAAMEVTRVYSALTGRIESICAGNAACHLTQEAYGWDAAGNLSSHQKDQRYLEGFTYDSLNRLVEGKVLTWNGASTSQVTLAQGYDALGNVCAKNGLGYGYGGGSNCGGPPWEGGGGPPVDPPPVDPPPYDPIGDLIGDVYNPNPSQCRPDCEFIPPQPPGPPVELMGVGPGASGLQSIASVPGAGAAHALAAALPRLGPPVLAAAAPLAGAMATATNTTATSTTATSTPLSIPPAGSPHAVRQTGSGATATFYYYDGRGNQTMRDAPGTANDRRIRYSLDDKAYRITMGSGQEVRFWYGPDGQRYKRQEGGKTTLYLGGVEVVIQNGVRTFKRTLGGIVVQTVANGGVTAMKYLFHDHLGSLVRIANSDGSLAERLDYAAFGERRGGASPFETGSGSSTTDRGFTGHEMIDGTGVIHMNGRIYDAQLGRFLQADPVIQAPDNAQSWNAYTYVFNNPLAYTDPSGMISLKNAFRMLVGLVITYFTWGAAAPYLVAGASAASIATGVGIMAAGGFAAGVVTTGTLKGGIRGAFTAALTAGIGVSGLDAPARWRRKR